MTPLMLSACVVDAIQAGWAANRPRRRGSCTVSMASATSNPGRPTRKASPCNTPSRVSVRPRSAFRGSTSIAMMMRSMKEKTKAMTRIATAYQASAGLGQGCAAGD